MGGLYDDDIFGYDDFDYGYDDGYDDLIGYDDDLIDLVLVLDLTLIDYFLG
nr:9197_t:CDS:2 [Entrophospora candida]CAG8566974.1 13542_t:CDS:2 [Entrophospora candida]